MTARILKGSALATQMRRKIEEWGNDLHARGARPLVLATVLVGNDGSSEAYRLSITRTFARVGIDHRAVDLPSGIDPASFVARITDLNANPEITGVMVLMPLPEPLTADLVLEHLSPLKDVDGITPTNAGRLHMGLPSLRPSTPQGGIELLDHYGIELAGARAVVIGRSNVVGRPLATLLSQRHATVTVCHRQTIDLAGICLEADLVAVAAGHPGLVTANMVRPGATVIDFGVNVVKDGIVGDADFPELVEIAGAITPVPGGTGPVTALVLARNTVAAAYAALEGDLDQVMLVQPLPPG